MKKLCLVGGVSTIGKSQTIERLCEDPFFVFYKFHHLLRREFLARGIDLGDALKHWREVVPDCAVRYVRDLPESVCSLSDIHFAVQPEYDLKVVNKEIVGAGTPTNEPYACGVDSSLIKEITEADIDVRAVLLKTSAQEILERRAKRLTDRGMTRSFSICDIRDEQAAEESFYRHVCSELNLSSGRRIVLDNSSVNYDRNVEILAKLLKTEDET